VPRHLAQARIKAKVDELRLLILPHSASLSEGGLINGTESGQPSTQNSMNVVGSSQPDLGPSPFGLSEPPVAGMNLPKPIFSLRHLVEEGLADCLVSTLVDPLALTANSCTCVPCANIIISWRGGVPTYKFPHGNDDLLNSNTMWETCRATFAASSFFAPIIIRRYGEEFRGRPIC